MIDVILVKYNQPILESMAAKSVLESTSDIGYHLTAYQNKKGVGLAKVWNQLIDASDAEFICLLNTDTIVTKHWLSRMRQTFDEEPNVGTVQPSSNFGNKSTIDTPGLHQNERSWLSINQWAHRYATRTAQKNREIEIASAFCLMFDKDTWHQAGKFDEAFFMFGEDSEFSWRVKNKLGKRAMWRVDTYVHHYGRQSVTRAVKDGDFNYDELRAESTRLWRLKTGKDVETGEDL